MEVFFSGVVPTFYNVQGVDKKKEVSKGPLPRMHEEAPETGVWQWCEMLGEGTSRGRGERASKRAMVFHRRRVEGIEKSRRNGMEGFRILALGCSLVLEVIGEIIRHTLGMCLLIVDATLEKSVQVC